ncbi:MAG: glucose 1-dehydrogenase [Proteobacteria bacterium]|nr:glucose 1-dehydrogenase [Pseudomonadota bacterium]
MTRFAGKVALVSGAARGLGALVAQRLHAEGASVIIGDVRDGEGEALARGLGTRASYLHLDVASEAQWTQAVATAQQRFGPVTILVNNAGVYRTHPTLELAAEEYMNLVRINQLGTFLGMRAVIAGMRDAGGGSIVNVASTAGVEGVPNALAYTASKHAVVGMTRAAALEFGAARVRVNAVCPGAMLTPLLAESYNISLQALAQVPFPNAPLGRMGDPAEIAPTVLFLASDESSYTTGSAFVVDGGLTAGVQPQRAGQ